MKPYKVNVSEGAAKYLRDWGAELEIFLNTVTSDHREFTLIDPTGVKPKHFKGIVLRIAKRTLFLQPSDIRKSDKPIINNASTYTRMDLLPKWSPEEEEVLRMIEEYIPGYLSGDPQAWQNMKHVCESEPFLSTARVIYPNFKLHKSGNLRKVVLNSLLKRMGISTRPH